MIELEQKLLSRLVDPAEITLMWDMGIRPEVLEQPLNQAVFSFSLEYWLENEMKMAPTLAVLEHEFPGVQIEQDVEESTIWLVERLQQRYASSELQEMLRDAAITSDEDPFGTLKKLWAAAHSASETVAPRFERINLATNVDDRERRHEERHEHGRGITLGLPLLDEHTNGLLPGELAAVGAYSKVGKTVFLVNAAVQARKQGFTPVLFTLEMNIHDIEDRIDAFFSAVSYNRLTHDSLSSEESRILKAARREMAALGPFYLERPDRGDRTVRHLVNRVRQLGADYLIIDQLSFMDAEVHHRDITSKHLEIISQLKEEISRERSGAVPCLLAVQLNRASLNQNEGIGLQNFANTSAIEQTVDVALGLSRTREETSNRMMRLDILGARRSETKSWMCRWDLANLTRIEILEEVVR